MLVAAVERVATRGCRVPTRGEALPAWRLLMSDHHPSVKNEVTGEVQFSE